MACRSKALELSIGLVLDRMQLPLLSGLTRKAMYSLGGGEVTWRTLMRVPAMESM